VSLGVMLLRRWVRNPRRLETTRCGELGPLPMEKLRNFENRAADSGPLPAALVLASLDATFALLGSVWSWSWSCSCSWFPLPVPAPGHSKPRARDYVKERAVIDRHTLTPTHKNTDTLPDATARPLRSLAWIFLYRLQIDSLVHKKYDFDLVELWSSAAPGSSYYFLYFFSRRRAARLRRNSSSVRSVVRAGAKVTSVWRWFAQWKRPELVAFVGIQPGRPSSPPCVFPGRRTTAHAPAPPPGIRPIGWQSCPAVAFPSAFPGPLLSPS